MKNYVEMKQWRKVTKASVAMQVLQCRMFIDLENEMFYDDPYNIDDPTVSWSLGQGDESPARTSQLPQQQGIIITCDTVAQLVLTTTPILENKASASKVPATGVDTLFIELCASEDSELTKQVPYRSAALRITEKEDRTFSSM